MPRIDSETKHQRKERVWIAVQRHPSGVTEAEVAAFLGMSRQRRTVNNYLRELESEGKIYKDGTLWLPLDYQATRLRALDLSPEEAMTLYLAARLLVKQQDKRNEPAETALLKLAQALTADAGVGQEIEQAARELAQQAASDGYESIFRTIIQGYIYRKRVELRYRPFQGQSFATEFATYLIEPSAIGYSTYIVGYSSAPDALRTYKVERIEEARLTRKDYSIPRDFPGLEILHNAWSIIIGDELTRIMLRFSPRVRKRVLETTWHHSEQKEEDPSKPGFLLWSGKVADTTDMLPWIRGWGADVEVLEPKRLVDELRAHTQKLARIYGVIGGQGRSLTDLLRSCWGKTGDTDWEYHPAVYHMLDVGHVAYRLLTDPSSHRWRWVMARALSADAEDLSEWLPWLIALHDIGKISVPFQALNEVQMARLRAAGFEFGKWQSGLRLHHTIMGPLFLTKEYPRLNSPALPGYLQRALIEMFGGHHGRFATASDLKNAGRTWRRIQEPDIWPRLRVHAAQFLQAFLLQRAPDEWPQPGNVSVAIMALTGFTILCDWLGSDSRYFRPYPDTDPFDYIPISRHQAEAVVKEAGFFQKTFSNAPVTFAELFPDRLPPRPLQAAIDDIPSDILAQPCLAIIEAPTGEGKTEAALTLTRRLAVANDTDEFYCALPTTATSNQMFGRLQKHLRDRLDLSVQVKLVHGQAFLIEDDLRIEPLGDDGDEVHPALLWFNPKKRALLAPFGVGTIDQAELSALNVPHNALRLIGLAGKVVILDEVHAYDTYMTTIVEQMLRWLSAMGSSVILLSATLPAAKRASLAKAYGLLPESGETLQAYPNLWIGGDAGSYWTSPPAFQPDRRLSLASMHFPHDEPQAKADWLLKELADVGCGCWITNTVERAQQLYVAVRQRAPELNCTLLHARFPLEERQRIEGQLAANFGPNGRRPHRGLVIGTQVLEQSLDLDFDLMISDLAPIDLLLQRAGRLHRHQRSRPPLHREPRLWVHCELGSDDSLRIGADRFYSEYLLRKTWEELKPRSAIHLPADYRTLVESVYDESGPPINSSLWPAWKSLQRDQVLAQQEAQLRLTPEPDSRRPFSANDRSLFVEDEDSAAWIIAQTRLSPESVTIIPLERVGDNVRLIPTDETIELSGPKSRADQLRLLRRSLHLSHWLVVRTLKEGDQELPLLFTESPLLKGTLPLWFANGEALLELGDRRVRLLLDPEMGLVISDGE